VADWPIGSSYGPRNASGNERLFDHRSRRPDLWTHGPKVTFYQEKHLGPVAIARELIDNAHRLQTAASGA
jgi:hypothetical protein